MLLRRMFSDLGDEGLGGRFDGATVLRVAFEAAQRSATDFEEVLDNQTAEALLGCRQRNTDLLLGEVFDALGSTEPSLRVTLHAEADPWVTGASPGLTPWSGGGRCMPCWSRSTRTQRAARR